LENEVVLAGELREIRASRLAEPSTRPA